MRENSPNASWNPLSRLKGIETGGMRSRLRLHRLPWNPLSRLKGIETQGVCKSAYALSYLESTFPFEGN